MLTQIIGIENIKRTAGSNHAAGKHPSMIRVSSAGPTRAAAKRQPVWARLMETLCRRRFEGLDSPGCDPGESLTTFVTAAFGIRSPGSEGAFQDDLEMLQITLGGAHEPWLRHRTSYGFRLETLCYPAPVRERGNA